MEISARAARHADCGPDGLRALCLRDPFGMRALPPRAARRGVAFNACEMLHESRIVAALPLRLAQILRDELDLAR